MVESAPDCVKVPEGPVIVKLYGPPVPDGTGVIVSVPSFTVGQDVAVTLVFPVGAAPAGTTILLIVLEQPALFENRIE